MSTLFQNGAATYTGPCLATLCNVNMMTTVCGQTIDYCRAGSPNSTNIAGDASHACNYQIVDAFSALQEYCSWQYLSGSVQNGPFGGLVLADSVSTVALQQTTSVSANTAYTIATVTDAMQYAHFFVDSTQTPSVSSSSLSSSSSSRSSSSSSSSRSSSTSSSSSSSSSSQTSSTRASSASARSTMSVSTPSSTTQARRSTTTTQIVTAQATRVPIAAATFSTTSATTTSGSIRLGLSSLLVFALLVTLHA